MLIAQLKEWVVVQLGEQLLVRNFIFTRFHRQYCEILSCLEQRGKPCLEQGGSHPDCMTAMPPSLRLCPCSVEKSVDLKQCCVLLPPVESALKGLGPFLGDVKSSQRPQSPDSLEAAHSGLKGR